MKDVFIGALSVELPARRESIDHLVRSHPDEALRLSRLGYRAVAVETERQAGELALAAVRKLPENCTATLDLVIHALYL